MRNSFVQNVYSLFMIIRLTSCVTIEDFYPYEDGESETSPHLVYEMPVVYPHWSDMQNKIINVVSSGVIRFSGINAANTLDVLIYGISLPFFTENTIGRLYIKSGQPDRSMVNKIISDLEQANNDVFKEGFVPVHLFTVTWIDVQFTSSPAETSTFQMNFVTNGVNATYLIAFVEKINFLAATPPIYPEFDLRFSYNDGLICVRSGFLQKETGVATKTSETIVTATQQSNSGLSGRWILDLTESPVNETVDATQPPDIENSEIAGGISFQGVFSFQRLFINGLPLVTETDNSKVTQLVQEGDSFENSEAIDREITNWINNVFTKIDAKPSSKIMSFSEGSLIVNYHVTIENNDEVCGKFNSTLECEAYLRERIRNITNSGIIDEPAMSGTLNTSATELKKTNECLQPPGTFCDVNAICYDLSEQYTYSCVCKSGYIGSGFPGTCSKKKDSKVRTAIIATSIATLAIVLLVLLIANQARKRDLEEEIFQQNLLRQLEYKQQELDRMSELSRSRSLMSYRSSNYSRRKRPARKQTRFR